jgi:hypothetical protein
VSGFVYIAMETDAATLEADDTNTEVRVVNSDDRTRATRKVLQLRRTSIRLPTCPDIISKQEVSYNHAWKNGRDKPKLRHKLNQGKKERTVMVYAGNNENIHAVTTMSEKKYSLDDSSRSTSGRRSRLKSARVTFTDDKLKLGDKRHDEEHDTMSPAEKQDAASRGRSRRMLVHSAPSSAKSVENRKRQQMQVLYLDKDGNINSRDRIGRPSTVIPHHRRQAQIMQTSTSNRYDVVSAVTQAWQPPLMADVDESLHNINIGNENQNVNFENRGHDYSNKQHCYTHYSTVGYGPILEGKVSNETFPSKLNYTMYGRANSAGRNIRCSCREYVKERLRTHMCVRKQHCMMFDNETSPGRTPSSLSNRSGRSQGSSVTTDRSTYFSTHARETEHSQVSFNT